VGSVTIGDGATLAGHVVVRDNVLIAAGAVSRTTARAWEAGSGVSGVNFNASVLTTALCPRQSVEPQR